MPTTDQDARALTYIACRIRSETHGARDWDDTGTYAVIAELIGQNLPITVERVTRHASDPEAKTPGAIRRPFVPDPPAGERAHPPKRHEQCRRCGGVVPSCACTREHLAAEYDDDPPPPVAGTGPDAARAALRAARVEGEAS